MRQMISQFCFVLISTCLLWSGLGTAMAQVPDGFYLDRFDYPIGERGYEGVVPVPISEQLQPNPNNLYPEYTEGALPNRFREVGGENWWNSNDVGNHVAEKHGMHPAEDWNWTGETPEVGQLVYAAANGKVISKGPVVPNNESAWGYYLVLKHSVHPDDAADYDPYDTFYTVYMHIAPKTRLDGRFNSAGVIHAGFDVEVDDWVRRGDVIGVIGDITQPGVGDHLHFELRHSWGESLYPNDNGSGYYGYTKNNTMNREQILDGISKLALDGFEDPSDFIDKIHNDENHHRPRAKQILVNGGWDIYGGTLDNSELFIRFKIIGDPQRFALEGINQQSLSNFKLSRIYRENNAVQYSELAHEDAFFIVPGSFEQHPAGIYTFKLRIIENHLAAFGAEMGIKYSLGFDINNGSATLRAFARDKLYFLNAETFTDMPAEGDEGDWVIPYIRAGVANGLFKGSGAVFDPTRQVTRAEMAAVIINTRFRLTWDEDQAFFNANLDPFWLPGSGQTPAEGYFTDVDICHPFFPQIQTLRNAGIIQGKSNNSGVLLNEFGPNDFLSRAELSKLLVAALELTMPNNINTNEDPTDNRNSSADGYFSDVNSADPAGNCASTPNPWYFCYVRILANTIITNSIGEEEGKAYPDRIVSGTVRNPVPTTRDKLIFNPNSYVTRGEVAKFVTNTFLYKEEAANLTKNEEASKHATSETVNLIGYNFEQIQVGSGHAPQPLLLNGGTSASIYDNETLALTYPSDVDQDGDRLFFFWFCRGGTLVSTLANHRRVVFTPPQVSQPTTFKIFTLAGDFEGHSAPSTLRISVFPRNTNQTPSSISLTASLSPASANANTAIMVSGQATYNTGLAVGSGAVTITTSQNTWTAALNQNGQFSRTITAPNTSQNVSIRVSDGSLSNSITRPFTLLGTGSTSGFRLQTDIVHTFDDNGSAGVEWSPFVTDTFRTTDEDILLMAYFDQLNISQDLDLNGAFIIPMAANMATYSKTMPFSPAGSGVGLYRDSLSNPA